MTVSENPYHLREWTAPELLALAASVLPGVRVRGMNASERVLAYEHARGEQIRRILRLDPLGLRNVLPETLVKFAFARLSVLVRRRIGDAVAESRAITPADFSVVAESRPDALDLVAFCRP